MDLHKDQKASQTHGAHVEALGESGSDFVLIDEIQPPPRIELARERMLMCRLYLGLIRSMSDDYGAAFASHNDSATFRTIGIYVFLRTVMCAPVNASKIANASKTAARDSGETSARDGEARLRGTRRQRLSRHR